MRLKNRKHLPEAAEGSPWVIVVAAGCVDRLTRGQNSSDEPLFEFILNKIGDLTIHIEKRLIRDAKRL